MSKIKPIYAFLLLWVYLIPTLYQSIHLWEHPQHTVCHRASLDIFPQKTSPLNAQFSNTSTLEMCLSCGFEWAMNDIPTPAQFHFNIDVLFLPQYFDLVQQSLDSHINHPGSRGPPRKI